MQSSDIPTRFPIPFANGAGSGYVNTIPVASQIAITPGAASLTDGFPPLTFLDPTAGGVPPYGQDLNGILKEATAAIRWSQAGAPAIYDSSFSASIGGYPKGATVFYNDVLYRSKVENNTNVPAAGAYWEIFPLLATTAMVQAGVDNTTAVTPASLRGAMANSLAYNGYQKFPTGLIIQWGRATNYPGSGTTITLPIAWTLGAFGGVATDGGVSALTTGMFFPDLTHMTLYSRSPVDGSYSTTLLTYWIAFGW